MASRAGGRALWWDGDTDTLWVGAGSKLFQLVEGQVFYWELPSEGPISAIAQLQNLLLVARSQEVLEIDQNTLTVQAYVWEQT